MAVTTNNRQRNMPACVFSWFCFRWVYSSTLCLPMLLLGCINPGIQYRLSGLERTNQSRLIALDNHQKSDNNNNNNENVHFRNFKSTSTSMDETVSLPSGRKEKTVKNEKGIPAHHVLSRSFLDSPSIFAIQRISI
jgi:hypothetical protein